MLSGNLAAYEEDRLAFLLALRDSYGPVARFGPRSTVINDPDIALALLRDRSGSFGVRNDFLQRRRTGTEMTQRLAPRPLLNAALRPAAANGVAALLRRRLLPELAAVSSGTVGTDPVAILERAFSEALADFYFGPGSEHIAALTGQLLDELGHIIGNPFAVPAWLGSRTRGRIDWLYRDLLNVVVAALEHRSAAPEEFDGVATAIMAANREHPTGRIADMLIGALLAGHRVPAAGAAWLLMLVAERPEVQQAIRAEVAASRSEPTPGGSRGSEEATDVVRCVVMEGLRLYPPTWMVARTAERAVDAAGWQFPAGHTFLISPYVIHRDEELFADALTFDPQRWRSAEQRQMSILSFGAGIHLCPGRSLALTLISTAVTAVVNNYDLHRVPGAVRANPRTTLLPDGLRLRLAPRQNSPHRGTLNRQEACVQAPDFLDAAFSV